MPAKPSVKTTVVTAAESTEAMLRRELEATRAQIAALSAKVENVPASADSTRFHLVKQLDETVYIIPAGSKKKDGTPYSPKYVGNINIMDLGVLPDGTPIRGTLNIMRK